MAKIVSVSKLAKKLGFEIGDDVLTIGGFKMVDELDYLYFDNDKKFDVTLLRNGQEKTIKVSKREGESLGLEFNIEMKPYICKNHCIFCFVDQLPKGMRDTLYVKDDDYRYSFMCGSYVTMTNVKEEEIERIIRLHLSPLYISVHAFNDEIRKNMLRNPATLNLINVMRRLGKAGIKMHTQLVVCPGINDGEVLRESIIGLKGVEGVETCAVVPVGLTGHREGLDGLKPVDKQNAIDTIKMVEELHIKLDGFCWCSDEYYIKAGLKVGEASYYGAFDQIENGVGLIADFLDNYNYGLEECKDYKFNKSIGFITGTDFAPILRDTLKSLEQKLGVETQVYGIKNNFFGNTVTVAGLVTAKDIIEQVKDKKDAFVIPDNMLKEFEDQFLDGPTVKDLEDALGAKVIVVAHTGNDLFEKLVEEFEG